MFVVGVNSLSAPCVNGVAVLSPTSASANFAAGATAARTRLLLAREDVQRIGRSTPRKIDVERIVQTPSKRKADPANADTRAADGAQFAVGMTHERGAHAPWACARLGRSRIPVFLFLNGNPDSCHSWCRECGQLT